MRKKDSLLPEPFIRQEEYTETSEHETAGYEGMTEEQLTFLKTTTIDDEILEEFDDDFVPPENAVLMDVAGIKIHHADPVLMFDSKDVHLEVGDRVVVETKKGLSLGDVLVGSKRRYVKQHNLPRVIRKMSQGDVRQEERNKEKEKAALTLCKERIEKLKLSMKLIEVEYLHGGNKAVFYFSADGRVDFRELVRDLAQRLHTRIEMRQIGVRDVSRLVGGIGICGCRLCCNLYLREFKPISIRMAKDQNLVLNPQKVSGVCGRLLCCLTYENETYQKAAQSMPRVGRRVNTPDGEGRIRDRDVLKRVIRVQLNEETQLREYHVDQVDLNVGRGNDDGGQGHDDDAQIENGSDADSSNGEIIREDGDDASWSDDDSPSRS
jgi:cell fate regulator YaaT (PSP1 superfamily)